MHFYQLSIESAAKELNTDLKDGLAEPEAQTRLKARGENRLRKTNERSALAIFLTQFKDLLVAILAAAGFFSMYLGEYRDAVLMFGIIFVNTSVRFWQEYKAEKMLEALKALMVPSAKIIRDGEEREINAFHLVPGDLVLLEEGDGVPADIRLVESENFATNDFILTGEVTPQSKSHLIKIEREVAVTFQDNCVFSGVTVARGMARGVVFATGMESEIGKIARGSEEIIATPSPLQREVSNLAAKITQVAAAIIGLLILTRLAMHAGLREALVFSIGVAAAMVPEGMPTQISIALALGAGRLAAKNAIVKKLSAVETLGAATVIASDKTGTITKNEITINNCYFGGMHFFVSGAGYAPQGEIVDEEGKSWRRETIGELKAFFLNGYLSSTGKVRPPDAEHNTWYAIGDPTEAAFGTLALKAGYDLDEVDEQYQRIELFPFDSDRKRMTIIREHKGHRTALMKGALENVLESCTHFVSRGVVAPLTDNDVRRFLSLGRSHAFHSLRVLALAYKDLPLKDGYTMGEAETGLIFSGLVTMLDPPHDEVKGAVRHAFRAQMKVVMITGDNAATAKAVAHAIGMKDADHRLPDVVDGEELAALSNGDMDRLLSARAVIFSRVTPQDKLRIVELLKKRGEVVAVTGDGVNDALSLKRADIGIAMGQKGSEVAKEASDLVLLDDNFSTIVLAVQEGRTIYKNLEKTITSSLTANFGELFCVLFGFLAGFWGYPIPILAVQILAVDLIGEFLPLMFLTFDPPEAALMHEPPRDLKKHIVNGGSLRNIVFFGALMGLFAFLSFMAVFTLHAHETLHYERALAAAYVTIVFCQFMNILSRRTADSVFTDYFFSNGHLLAGFFLSIGFILTIVYLPVANLFFHTGPLAAAEWGYPLGFAALFLLAHELRKAAIKPVRHSHAMQIQ
ncbi:MAG: cation-transporting P-type ATPase [Nitrospinae bacterium]|nr:cation-transporting P-type ATPase [Nitrospinota bacterium]